MDRGTFCGVVLFDTPRFVCCPLSVSKLSIFDQSYVDGSVLHRLRVARVPGEEKKRDKP